MKLINGRFNGYREINGFSKDKILTIKAQLSKYTSSTGENEIDPLLKDLFPREILQTYSEYRKSLELFLSTFMIYNNSSPFSEENSYVHLKSALIKELDKVSQNLRNLKLNIQNVQRFLDKNDYLSIYLSDISNLIESLEQDRTLLGEKVGGTVPRYKDSSYLWTHINKITNLPFEFMPLPEKLRDWEEFSVFASYVRKAGVNVERKEGLLKKKVSEIEIRFGSLLKFCDQTEAFSRDVCLDVLYLLFSNKYLVKKSPTDSLSEKVKAEGKEEVKSLLQSLIKNAICDIFGENIERIKNFEESNESTLTDGVENHLNAILDTQKISDLLPELIEYYFRYIELDYKNKLQLSSYEDVDTVDQYIEQYSQSIESLHNKVNLLESSVQDLTPFMGSFDYLIEIYQQVFSSLLSEIVRRKDELIYYLRTVRNEWIQEDLRAFINTKISSLDEILAEYQEKIGQSLTKEFPPLKNLELILEESEKEIQTVKEQVSEKLTQYKQKNVKQYTFIKKWEEIFTRRKRQIHFFLIRYVIKIMHKFEDVLEKEDKLYSTLNEIRTKSSEGQGLPLNYLLSTYITDKLTEQELRERITHVKDKIRELANLKQSYSSELSKLQDALVKKVKKIKDITTETVQCTVCHEDIDLTTDKIIRCPFCGAVYHYLCIVFWLSEYNSCPSCQNAFLDPNSNIYEPS